MALLTMGSCPIHCCSRPPVTFLQDLVPHSLLPPRTFFSDQSFLLHCLLPLHMPFGVPCPEQFPSKASGQAGSPSQVPLAPFAYVSASVSGAHSSCHPPFLCIRYGLDRRHNPSLPLIFLCTHLSAYELKIHFFLKDFIYSTERERKCESKLGNKQVEQQREREMQALC